MSSLNKGSWIVKTRVSLKSNTAIATSKLCFLMEAPKSILIKIDSNGPVFYCQSRVGFKGKEFRVFKFMSMRLDSDKMGLLTVGGEDPRITRSGFFIRKYKM